MSVFSHIVAGAGGVVLGVLLLRGIKYYKGRYYKKMVEDTDNRGYINNLKLRDISDEYYFFHDPVVDYIFTVDVDKHGYATCNTYSPHTFTKHQSPVIEPDLIDKEIVMKI